MAAEGTVKWRQGCDRFIGNNRPVWYQLLPTACLSQVTGGTQGHPGSRPDGVTGRAAQGPHAFSGGGGATGRGQPVSAAAPPPVPVRAEL